MNKKIAILIAPICATLAGCSGGGGGGGGVAGAASPVAFTSFSAVPKPGTVEITGSTLEGTYASNSSFLVTSGTGPTAGSGKVTATYDAAGNQTAVTVAGSQSSVNFSTTDGSTSTRLTSAGAPGAILAVSANGRNAAVSADQSYMGFSYQTFGIWETGLGTQSGAYGATSVGAATAGASIPTTGTATFTGVAGGGYIDATGANYLAAGDATLNANFGTRSVGLATTNTSKLNASTLAVTTAANLNLSGTLTYAAGANSLSGTVSTADGMTGQVNGRFYGPSATEIGGTFATAGTGVKMYGGGYGAKR